MLPLEASEVVRDLELKTIKRKDCTTHIFYERGTSATDRKRELREKWTPVRPLGNGAFGSVWLEQCDNMVRRDVPNVRAVKKIKISPSIDFTRELEAIAKFSHNRYLPCFVRCFGWFRIKNYIFITMEHIQHGDLGQHLQFQRILPEKEANIIIRQLVEGLGHMHTNRFVHRDLKPANILIVEKGPNWLVQISDFGISRKLDEGRSIGTAQQGTFGYIAPEVMGFHEERGFPFAADMWSLGAVLFRMLSGHAFLIYGHEHREFVNGDRLIPVNELKEVGVSDEGLEFLQKLLLVNPRDRLTVDEAHKHDWMKTFIDATITFTRVEDSTSGSEVEDEEYPEFEPAILAGTGLGDTGLTKPSALWSDQAPTNPYRPSILDELELSDDEGKMEDHATLQVVNTQMLEAPSAPSLVAEPLSQLAAKGGENQIRSLVIRGKDPETQPWDSSSFLPEGSTGFMYKEYSRHTSDLNISETHSNNNRSHFQAQSEVESVSSLRQSGLPGGKPPITYRKPTVEDASDEDWESPVHELGDLFPVDTGSTSKTTCAEDSDYTWNSTCFSPIFPQATFISDGSTVWRREQLKVNPDGSFTSRPPRPPSFYHPPRTVHQKPPPRDWSGSESCSGLSGSTNETRRRQQEGKNFCGGDAYATQSESEWTDSDNLSKSHEPTLTNNSPDGNTDGSSDKSPSFIPEHNQASKPPSDTPADVGIKKSWPCYKCLRETPFRINGYYFSCRTKFCHEECGKVLCDECWVLDIKQFFLNKNRILPRCPCGDLVLDYDKKRRSVNLNHLGNLYLAFKYTIETDAFHCCPHCVSLVGSDLSSYTTRLKRSPSGRSCRVCDGCGKRYCDKCLKEIDPTGSKVHGKEPGRFCKTWEEIEAYIERLEGPFGEYRQDELDRIFLNACAYIEKAGGPRAIHPRYHRELA